MSDDWMDQFINRLLEKKITVPDKQLKIALLKERSVEFEWKALIHDDTKHFVFPQEFPSTGSSFTDNKTSKNFPLSNFIIVLCFIIRVETALWRNGLPGAPHGARDYLCPHYPFG